MLFMQISGTYNSAAAALSSSLQTSQTAASSQNSSAATSNPVQWFMAYAKESPGQQLFTSWLGSQNVSQAQYNAMSPQEQQKLRAEFEQHLKTEMAPSAYAASIPVLT
jgi:hypothetical protein